MGMFLRTAFSATTGTACPPPPRPRPAPAPCCAPRPCACPCGSACCPPQPEVNTVTTSNTAPTKGAVQRHVLLSRLPTTLLLRLSMFTLRGLSTRPRTPISFRIAPYLPNLRRFSKALGFAGLTLGRLPLNQLLSAYSVYRGRLQPTILVPARSRPRVSLPVRY